MRGSLDEFEVKIRRYERTCGSQLSRRALKMDDLRHHLLMHAALLSTYPLVREEIRSVVMARDTPTGPASMDVSAVYKGKGKGKGKGKKGKGKGKGKDRQEQGEGSRDAP